MTVVKIFSYTLMNIRYSALILPCGVVAYLLQLYPLAVIAGILLVAAFAAEVALSVANGVEMHQQVTAQKLWAADEDDRLARALADIERYSNDWTDQHGSEAEAGEAGSEAGRREEGPPEGEAGIRG